MFQRRVSVNTVDIPAIWFVYETKVECVLLIFPNIIIFFINIKNESTVQA